MDIKFSAEKNIIKKEKELIFEKHFKYFLKEQEDYERELKKFKKPPFSQFNSLLKNKYSRFILLKILRILSFIFPNKK